MPPTTSTTKTTTPVVYRKAHPIRGILWGLLMGLGATVVAILLKIIPLDLVWAVLVLAGGILLGILWSTLGPAKKPKGDPPWHADQVTHRPDWDSGSPPSPASPASPSPPEPPGLEPLHIQPLDVEPLDLDSPAPDVPSEAATDTTPTPPDTVADTVADTAVDPPRTIDPPDRSAPPPPPPPPSSTPPPPPPPSSSPPPPPPPPG